MGVTPIAIEYVAPAACPDEISLRAGVIARLGTDPFRGDAPRVAMIDVEPTGAGFVAAIELREPGHEVTRRAVGPAVRCEDAVAALELALAVIIDPTYSSQPVPPPQQPAPLPPTAPVVYEPPGWRVAPPSGPPPLRRHELAFAVGVVAGTHPDSEGTFGLRAGYMVDEHWRIGMLGRLANGNGTLTMDSSGERTYETRTSELEVEGCRRYHFAIGCVLLGLGSKSVNIRRYDVSVGTSHEVADYSDLFAIAGANLSLEVPLGHAFLRPLVEANVPLPNVPIESEGLRHVELPAVVVAFDLALGYRW